MDENKRRLGRAACEVVVRAVRQHRADEAVQREGKAALRNLSSNNPDNRSAIEALHFSEHLSSRPSHVATAATAGGGEPGASATAMSTSPSSSSQQQSQDMMTG